MAPQWQLAEYQVLEGGEEEVEVDIVREEEEEEEERGMLRCFAFAVST